MGIFPGAIGSGSQLKKFIGKIQGFFEDFKPLILAFIKGLLTDRIPDRVNFINAELLAKERGIVIEYGATNEKGGPIRIDQD
ncbi:MAG: hypothetical protein CM1200mP10_19000 [Candidatus Neomarinimicrobiota bacterium]|nr:MAG: hypothetical protein CM1200mP10_19000 [Candidatus Neomarinimicrobiota bacterium]